MMRRTPLEINNMDLLLKDVRIVDFNKDFNGDIYIKNGIIEEVEREIKRDCRTIACKGFVALPSFVDMHCHFRDPGFTYKEDIETGSHAAVKGGYTGVNLMANTNPPCSTMDTVNYVLNKAKAIGIVDFHQTVSITKDLKGKSIDHLDDITYPVRFISDDGKGVYDDRLMYEAMEKAKQLNLTVISHAENKDITPIDTRLSENIETVRNICLAENTKARLHMAHVSTKEAMDAIIEAKIRGVDVTCEVTPHHIYLDNSFDYRVNPPLRDREDIEFLIDAIKNNYVDVISTDHAPHSLEDKKNGAPGISGIETAFSVCFTALVQENNITLNKLSEIMSKNPSQIMGLNKGKIEKGYDGDITIVDINKKVKVDSKEFASKGKNTPFDGMELFGEVVMTIKGGKIVYSKGDNIDDN